MRDLKAAFELLDIAPSTDEKIVRRAWRALVRSYHPDMAKSDPVGANKRLAEINAAFDAVCACTAEEVQRLHAEAARRQRLKRQRARHQTHARGTAQKAEKTALVSVSERHAGQGTALKLREATGETNGQSTRTDARGFGRTTAESALRAERPKAQWSVAIMADKAFRSARIICGPQRRPELTSYYL